MNEAEFEQWRNALLSLDRYENPTDARTFVKLAKDVQAQLDGRVVDTLLDTFGDADDYGIQESILGVLDKADAKLYAERLAFKFPDLLRNASVQEWPLLLIGRIVNSNDTEKMRAIVDVAQRTQGSLNEFIHSQSFLGGCQNFRVRSGLSITRMAGQNALRRGWQTDSWLPSNHARRVPSQP